MTQASSHHWTKDGHQLIFACIFWIKWVKNVLPLFYLHCCYVMSTPNISWLMFHLINIPVLVCIILSYKELFIYITVFITSRISITTLQYFCINETGFLKEKQTCIRNLNTSLTPQIFFYCPTFSSPILDVSFNGQCVCFELANIWVHTNYSSLLNDVGKFVVIPVD